MSQLQAEVTKLKSAVFQIKVINTNLNLYSLTLCYVCMYHGRNKPMLSFS